MANKVIITCAITGSIHTPTMSDALPITPDQIGRQGIAAAQAGGAGRHPAPQAPPMWVPLRITPDQIPRQAIDAAQAGAAVLHLHARDPKDGKPSPDPAV